MKWLKPVLLAITAALFLRVFVFDFIIAEGHSMEPSIHDGAVLIISRLRYGLRFPRRDSGRQYLTRWALPRTGEILIFYTPEGDLAVKRCVRTEGMYFYAEGDNSLASYDSRAYGPVPLENIIGKVLEY